MKVAVTYENGQVFQHFGHTNEFKVFEIQDGQILSWEIVGNGGQGHGALATVLQDQGVQALICGGIGGGARTALANRGIQVFGGVTGSADEAAAAYAAGKLSYDPNAHCDHHQEAGHDHACGHNHSCE